MGIRYDKDSLRANNGPTIYFTDPTSLLMLRNEIRSALEANLSVYVYRRPGDMMITFGTSESVVEGLEHPGFVIAPFLPSLPYLTIPFKPVAHASGCLTNKFPFPARSTNKEEHRAEIDAIQTALRENGGGKIIAARIIVEEGSVSVADTFFNLCQQNPNAFVFCFNTPQTGCWIGASPELLLESRRGLFPTMALAGTRPADSEGPWDEKNIEEQRMVTDFIEDMLATHNIKSETGETFTFSAGKVEHICTPISGETEEAFSSSRLSELLHSLSPTPALCGLPRELALKVISSQENGDRGCYGGFCGPYRSPQDFQFQVILRCARIEQKRFCLYAGGGITLKSSPESEWKETELKATTLLDSLRLN